MNKASNSVTEKTWCKISYINYLIFKNNNCSGHKIKDNVSNYQQMHQLQVLLVARQSESDTESQGAADGQLLFYKW